MRMNERIAKRLQRFVDRKRDSHKLKSAERFSPSVEQGLSDEQVASRVADKLTNQRSLYTGKPYWKIIFGNIFNFCNLTCIVLVILLCAIGAWDYTISTSIIFINIAIGIYQEIKAKHAVGKLAILHRSDNTVVRGGAEVRIPDEQIVLDDILSIGAGEQIPVDAIVAKGNVEVDESILTGESVPVKRGEGDRLLAGSSIVAGQAYIRADRVGKDCYIEGITRIARRVNAPKSTIFRVLNDLIKGISVVLVILATFLLIADRVSVQGEWKQTIITVSSSILGMLPVGMFLLTSTALAASVLKLSKKHALPQDLYSIEMLAMVDTLLLDKTGTITDGNQEVREVRVLHDAPHALADLMHTMDIATRDRKPTALALARHFADGAELEYADCMPFSSERKCSAITLADGDSYFLGAPDYVSDCDVDLERICEDNAACGRRTLLLSRFHGAIGAFDKAQAEPLALFALEDTVRDDVQDTLQWFYNNGVDIKIVSGDNPRTVGNIAGKCGVRNYDCQLNCANVSDEELTARVEETAIFGRVSPEQKCKIVHTLQDKGKVVGMIGDGVNDVQALKDSDCSISFAQANDVARNISRIVLLDNRFATLPEIVGQGRQVIRNVEKVAALYIMKNIFVMFMSLLFSIVTIATRSVSYPFDTKKMLLIEFFVIGAPTFIYALQPTGNAPVRGDFMLNILRSSLAAAIALIVAVCVAWGLTFTFDYTGMSAQEIFDYKAAFMTAVMTATGFVALLIISMPPDKLRLATVFVMAALSVGAVFVDTYLLDGTLFDMQIVSGTHAGWVMLCMGLGAVVNLLARYVGDRLYARYGEKIALWGKQVQARRQKRKLGK